MRILFPSYSGIGHINKLAIIGYAIMLIQHVVIYLVMHHIPIDQVSQYVYSILILFYSYSNYINIAHYTKLYKPLEDYLVGIINKDIRI